MFSSTPSIGTVVVYRRHFLPPSLLVKVSSRPLLVPEASLLLPVYSLREYSY